MSSGNPSCTEHGVKVAMDKIRVADSLDAIICPRCASANRKLTKVCSADWDGGGVNYSEYSCSDCGCAFSSKSGMNLRDQTPAHHRTVMALSAAKEKLKDDLLPVSKMTDGNPFTKPQFREAYEKYPWFEGYCDYPFSRVIKDGMSFSSACELARELANVSDTAVQVARLLVYPVWHSSDFDEEEQIVDWNVRFQPDEQWGVVAPNSLDYDTVARVFSAYELVSGDAYAEQLALEDRELAVYDSFCEDLDRNFEKDTEIDLLREELFGGDDYDDQ